MDKLNENIPMILNFPNLSETDKEILYMSFCDEKNPYIPSICMDREFIDFNTYLVFRGMLGIPIVE